LKRWQSLCVLHDQQVVVHGKLDFLAGTDGSSRNGATQAMPGSRHGLGWVEPCPTQVVKLDSGGAIEPLNDMIQLLHGFNPISQLFPTHKLKVG
jgi:hypothetical protein